MTGLSDDKRETEVPTPRTTRLIESKPRMWREWKDSDFHDLAMHAHKIERELAEAKARNAYFEELEASLCPEDYGFAEYIGVLMRRLAERDNEIAELRARVVPSAVADAVPLAYCLLNSGGKLHWSESCIFTSPADAEGELEHLQHDNPDDGWHVAPFYATPVVASEGMTIDEDARWAEIQALAWKLGKRPIESLTEVEAALCGAFWRAKAARAELARLRAANQQSESP